MMNTVLVTPVADIVPLVNLVDHNRLCRLSESYHQQNGITVGNTEY